MQVPGASYGSDVDNLPNDVEAVYSEIRRCVQYTAYTAAVLGMRNLLSHVNVDLGADGDKSFNYFVSYLDERRYITPNARGWVDILRGFGNEVTHELRMVTENDAQRFSGASLVPLGQLGVLSNTYTSSDALGAANDPLILDVERTNQSMARSMEEVARLMMALDRGISYKW